MDTWRDLATDSSDRVIYPYASLYVATYQPIGGWRGRSALARLDDANNTAISNLLIRMKDDWERICRKFFTNVNVGHLLEGLSIGELPTVLAYQQPFISSIFKQYPDILEVMIKQKFCEGRVTVTFFRAALQVKRAEYLCKQQVNAQEATIRCEGQLTYENVSAVVKTNSVEVLPDRIGCSESTETAPPSAIHSSRSSGGEVSRGFNQYSQGSGGLGERPRSSLSIGNSGQSRVAWGGGSRIGHADPQNLRSSEGIGGQNPRDGTDGLIPGVGPGVITPGAEAGGLLIPGESGLQPGLIPTEPEVPYGPADEPRPPGRENVLFPEELVGIEPGKIWVAAAERELWETMRRLGLTSAGRVSIGDYPKVPKNNDVSGGAAQECQISFDLVRLDLYIMLLEIEGMQRAAQDILDKGFEALKEYYKTIALNAVSDTNLQFTLSPLAFMDLYRQHIYDLGSFLGPAAEHIWVAPESTVELTEFVSVTEYYSIESESTIEIDRETEHKRSQKEDYLEELQQERENAFSLNQTIQGGFNAVVFNVQGATTFNYEDRTATTNRQVTNRVVEQSERVVNRLKQTQRITQTRSREETQQNGKRRVINNSSHVPRNYEIRRKYQRLGVAIEQLGSRLCWQLTVDDPGTLLNVAELFFVADKKSFQPLPVDQLEATQPEPHWKDDLEFLIPFKQSAGDDTHAVYHLFMGEGFIDNLYENDPTDGNVLAVDGNDAIQARFEFTVQQMPVGYQLCAIEPTRHAVGSGRMSPDNEPRMPNTFEYATRIKDPEKGIFRVYILRADFNDASSVFIRPRFYFEPTAEYLAKLEEKNKRKQEELEKEREEYLNQQRLEELRARIEAERSIVPRDSEELRAEERYAVLQAVVKKMSERTNLDTPEKVSELLRQYFDVDKIVYFVAPGWWKPRKAKEPYKVTEESFPAPFGSSLGWDIQPDGDNMRNAFLNSAWIRVAIPILPGMARDAIEWLKGEAVEGSSGLIDDPLKRFLEDDLEEFYNYESSIQQQLKTPGMAFGEFGIGQETISSSSLPENVITTWTEYIPTKQMVALSVEF